MMRKSKPLEKPLHIFNNHHYLPGCLSLLVQFVNRTKCTAFTTEWVKSLVRKTVKMCKFRSRTKPRTFLVLTVSVLGLTWKCVLVKHTWYTARCCFQLFKNEPTALRWHVTQIEKIARLSQSTVHYYGSQSVRMRISWTQCVQHAPFHCIRCASVILAVWVLLAIFAFSRLIFRTCQK